MKIEYIEKFPSGEEYNYLRKCVDWEVYNIELVERSIVNSLYSLCVYDDGKIIGMGRIIGDKGLICYIQDIIVIPEYQGKNIGLEIMNYMMNYIKNNLDPTTRIGLMSAPGKEDFYKKFGFIIRPNEVMGAGMMLKLNDNY